MVAPDSVRTVAAATPQHMLTGLSQDLQYKVFEASVTSTGFNAIASATKTGGSRRSNQVLLTAAVAPQTTKNKYRVRMSPLNTFL